ncbi:putative colicin V production protein-like protein [Desulfamplus magnetovallimortis]|uniref:Putative colicin V production protein-like protein n=1 Tax=Desulfamplus magnetovallimortis TaxID=1246637 RepID=A0A1W1H995_9BACT|nr:CvpA family protein [Desulfamplus magnetovallimortis]SLM29023.1 putative colicin V production protein-like protein [Desulfamplus magnetovallimortis]
MNLFDVFVVIVLSFCLIRGYFRGFIREISSIVGVVAGFYAAHTYYIMLASYLANWVDLGVYGNIISFILLFCVIFSLTSLIGHLIRLLLNVAFLGWVDGSCGVLFGALKGFLVISVAFIILTALLPGGASLIENSRTAPYVAHLSEMTAIFASKELKGEFRIKFDKMKAFWEKQKGTIQEIQKKNLPLKGA